jgi:hypothetical protein
MTGFSRFFALAVVRFNFFEDGVGALINLLLGLSRHGRFSSTCL